MSTSFDRIGRVIHSESQTDMQTSRATRILALAVATLALIFATPGLIPAARAGTTHTVQIVGFAFSPAEISVAVGDTVAWTNLDQAVHTATSTSGAFDSGDLDPGESFSVTFTTPGTYDYLCTPHPSMTGRIVVAAPTPTATAVTSTGGGGIPNVAASAPQNQGVLAQLVGLATLIAALVLAARQARSDPGSH